MENLADELARIVHRSAFGMTRLPDSRWLLQQGKPLVEARDALGRLRGKRVAPEVIEGRLRDVELLR